ncbi:rho GTPase activating protein 22 [Armillaria novae-zelandiae]|uniref:Rho GTPase activating protein 22 n=1 Tax=Armillaria novae-zelandiae TaxID=153914 RepID=A0AA39U0H3_9AGAR|nr:rho GTPase activating protein 22 [Armillaria novae-zelandiae]
MPRRGAPSSNTLSPQDSSSPNGPTSLRSNSPTAGITQFLSKPSKWFGRSVSSPKSSSGSSTEPRASNSSARKHKISHPTDPRPILDGYANSNARSVLDLSTRPPNSLDISPFHPPSSPSTPIASSTGLGDLRSMSRKAWSRSADDLGSMSAVVESPVSAVFQDKVAQYRNRSSGGGKTEQQQPQQHVASSQTGRQPFPTIITSVPPEQSPSSAPILSPVTISVSAPNSEEPTAPSRQSPPSHVHTRSHSFTPKLSSKLASPRFPPSPKRKGSGELDGKGAFPFGFGAHSRSIQPEPGPSSAPGTTGSRSNALLSPNTTVESETDDNAEADITKRASQIVYHKGLINRLADVPHNLQNSHVALSKGWKPFKLELKGSKLYFYKPPGDRSAAIKDLFPTVLVPPSQEEIAELELEGKEGGLETGGKDRLRKADGGVRKKRAYWGRRTHPDLSLDDSGTIQKGTFEALVHECVFGTTFFTSDASAEQEKWKDFASANLLCLPALAGQAKYEAEFLRCTEYLISGAEDDAKEDLRSRVVWLAGEYLRFHEVPADFSAWEEWRAETIPGASFAVVKPTSGSLTTSTSMQALYVPSPVGSPNPSPSMPNVASPNLGTFSPRPDEPSKLPSLMDLLTTYDSPPSPVPSWKGTSTDIRTLENQTLHPPFSPKTPPQASWATALDREGLSRDVLLSLDPQLIARTLTLFHRSALQSAPQNLTAGYILGHDGLTLAPKTSEAYFGALFGSDDRPHWLTKLLLMQILGADTSSGYVGSPHLSSPNRKSEERTSRTHSRSELISVWVRVAEICRANGDACTWEAIKAAVCCAPVARLEKVWKRVEASAVAAVEAWVYPDDDGAFIGVQEPITTPWGGDLRTRVKAQIDKVKDEGPDETLKAQSMETIRKWFETYRTAFSLCPRKIVLSDDEVSEDVKKLVTYWREMFMEGGGGGGIGLKFARIDQFMSLSLAAEPRRKGLFEPHFWSRPPSNYPPNVSLLPLVFPEPLPTVCLVDRSLALRGRLDSDAATDIHAVRAVDGRIRQEERRMPPFDPTAGVLASLSLGGTIIPVHNGDLLLVVQGGNDSVPSSRRSSRAPSRPPSSSITDLSEKLPGRTPSIRVKPGSSQVLDRKSSMARRSSLPALSNRPTYVTSEPSTDRPLRALVQAGTLNNLVDILVHGLKNICVSVADDNGEMSLREGTRELVVDRKEFSKVWWNVFRSFVTPLVFFELLRKMYIKAQPRSSPPRLSEYLSKANVRAEVLETMLEWVTGGGGAQDILDDPQLLQSLQSFLKSPDDHVFRVPADLEREPSLKQSMSSLREMRQSLRRNFRSQSMRPSSRTSSSSAIIPSPNIVRLRNMSARESPDIDRVNAEELVEILDGMACATFSNVTEEDLYITSDLLEVQSADRTGWFSSKEGPTAEDSIEIQTIYSHIQDVEPSLLISELGQDSLYRLLPPGVRSCIRAYAILRKWLISKIVAPRLGLQARQARMELLLRTIEISRIRNTEKSTKSRLIDQACVRSFVEAVVSSAVMSVESRMHYRAWQNVAASRNTQCDSLSSLLSRSSSQSLGSKDALTVDMGWVIERLLDVISTPDVVEPSQDGQSLVNFDKRRHLCNLIANTPPLHSSRQRGDIARRGFERLNNIEREVVTLQFDHRGIRDEGQREGLHGNTNGPPSTRRLSRPFQRIIQTQTDKVRRDRNWRSRLQKEKLLEQSRNEKREDMLNKAMRPRKRPGTPTKQHRNKKSMSAFLHFMRPISSAFGSEPTHGPELKRTVAELDFTPTGKPVLVLSLVDARVVEFINNERSYMFKVDTEDGGHYLLQAMNKRDMTKWLETINRVAKMAAKRRLTYIGSSPKPELSDLRAGSSAPSRDPNAVFGVDPQILLQREAEGGDVPYGALPKIIEQCLSEIESRGLTEVGIYRIAGATSEITSLRDAYNRGLSPIKSSTDIHAVCDLVKSWFRLLPEPVFPAASYFEIIEATKLDDLDARLSAIQRIVQSLPQANFDLLKRVSEHLDKVTDFEEYNQMTAEALSIVFSPNLLRPPKNDFTMLLANMGHTNKLVKALITHFHAIFDEADPDAEADADDEEIDSPIMEEEEDDAMPFNPDPEPTP